MSRAYVLAKERGAEEILWSVTSS